MVATIVKTAVGTGICALVGSVASDPNSTWYRSLKTPGWQPPDWVIPAVWTALYTDIAVTSALTLDQLAQRGAPERTGYVRALGTNLAINAAWSWVFFRTQRLAPATIGAGILTLSSTDLVRRTAKAGLGKAAALAPYALWCGFTTALTGSLLRRNPESA